MTLVITGSIATDYLMEFPGRISEQLVADQLDNVSLSFLADELRIVRGGVGANIAFGLGLLGQRPVLVGAVGPDFAEYRSWLEEHGVDTSHVHVSTKRHTARFLCTTDLDQNQIATFYAGAMTEARDIELAEVLAAHREVALVMVSPDDPDAMIRHTRACRTSGTPFAADPSQQIARLDGIQLRELVDGARWLFTNRYEKDLLVQKTGWTADEILARVGTWVVTHGGEGVEVLDRDVATVSVPAHAGLVAADPTGVGDAFRAGFLSAIGDHLPLAAAARAGCTLASFVLESVGTQEYAVTPAAFRDRVAQTYGEAAAVELDGLFGAVPTGAAAS